MHCEVQLQQVQHLPLPAGPVRRKGYSGFIPLILLTASLCSLSRDRMGVELIGWQVCFSGNTMVLARCELLRA